jgi:hypothetical protein
MRLSYKERPISLVIVLRGSHWVKTGTAGCAFRGDEQRNLSNPWGWEKWEAGFSGSMDVAATRTRARRTICRMPEADEKQETGLAAVGQ